MPRQQRSRLIAPLVLGGAMLFAVIGCAAEPALAPSQSPASTPLATPTTEAGPAFMPDGSAEENQPIFAQIVNEVWTGAEPVAGRAYVDALAAAGFDKSTMQVTQDLTTVGNPAESIQFSVAWNDGNCLVGQVGPATGDPVAVVVPALGTGGCMLGDTRPIDW